MFKNKKVSKLSDSLANMLVTTAISGAVLGGISKMSGLFGTSEIPKGVVKELMEGVMEGLITHFEIKVQDKEQDIKDLKKEISDLKSENKTLEYKFKTTLEALEGKKKKSSKTTQKSKK